MIVPTAKLRRKRRAPCDPHMAMWEGSHVSLSLETQSHTGVSIRVSVSYVMIRFSSPSALILLLLLLPLWVVARSTPPSTRWYLWQRRCSLCIRTLALLVIVGALA